jgi:hypothetical protein
LYLCCQLLVPLTTVATTVLNVSGMHTSENQAILSFQTILNKLWSFAIMATSMLSTVIYFGNNTGNTTGTDLMDEMCYCSVNELTKNELIWCFLQCNKCNASQDLEENCVALSTKVYIHLFVQLLLPFHDYNSEQPPAFVSHCLDVVMLQSVCFEIIFQEFMATIKLVM